MSATVGLKSLLLWQEQEVLQGYCWVQSRHPMQTKRLTERSQMAVMNQQMLKEKKRLRQANGNAYINLQLSCDELPYDLVSLAKTEELPDGCTRNAWERLTSEYDLTEGEDKITLLTMFQQNQLEDVRTNITVWLTSLAIQVNKLKKLHHVLDEEYQITHILASLPREYSSVVEQVKIDRRTSSALITMDEVKRRLKERYLQLKREHGWSLALSMKSGNNQNKIIKKGSKGKYFKGRGQPLWKIWAQEG